MTVVGILCIGTVYFRTVCEVGTSLLTLVEDLHHYHKLSDIFACPIGLRQGCLASPQLFAIFINELALHLYNSPGLRVQIMPNEIDIIS